MPYRQFPMNAMTLMVRSDADPAKLTAAIRAQVMAVDPSQPISNVKTLDEHISDSIAQPRLTMVLLGIFAALALRACDRRRLRRDVVHGGAADARDRHSHGARARASATYSAS